MDENVGRFQTQNACTGRERLIRTRLIQSSTKFEVSLKFWQESYHFMLKNNG